MISIRTVVNIFALVLLMGIIPAHIAAVDSESNVLQSHVQAEEEQSVVPTPEEQDSYDFNKVSFSENGIDPDIFENIGDDDDDDDDF